MLDISRTYDLVHLDGTRGEVVLRICESKPSGADWQVSVVITSTDAGMNHEMKIYGVDELQALQLSLRGAGALLESSRAFREGRLRWLGMSELIDQVGSSWPSP